jgi:hypothetical protein
LFFEGERDAVRFAVNARTAGDDADVHGGWKLVVGYLLLVVRFPGSWQPRFPITSNQ